MRQGLCRVSIGLDKECFSKINWLNTSDGSFGTIAMGLSRSFLYLIRSIENPREYIEDPKELWTRLDKTFGVIDEDHNSILERISSTISTLDPKISASSLSDEVVQDEEEAETSTQSIRIEDSLHAVTPSPDALKVHEISDISYSHISEIEQDIQISDIEEKQCCTSMQTFTSDFPLNFVQNFPVIASESEEKFDFLPIMLMLV